MIKRLVMVATGLNLTPTGWRELETELRKDPLLSPDITEWKYYPRRTRGLGTARLAGLAEELAAEIHQHWIRNGGYEEVILVGHSIGGLLMRGAYLIACGAASASRRQYDWCKAVQRIVLLAAPNRGVERLAWWLRPIDWFMRLFMFFVHFTYQDVMRGSAFVTSLRIDWIRYFHRPHNHPLPIVFQFLGSADNVVKQTDSTDILAFPEGSYVDVPGATHASIPDLSKAADRVGRVALIREAIVGPRAVTEVKRTEPSRKTPDFDFAVFVLHGIRDRSASQWVSNAVAAVAACAPPRTKVVPFDYNYFSALRFALPSVRRRNLKRFQDSYTEHLAQNPDALFYVLAHSNGTYLFGRSLQDVPAIQFEAAALGGSVLPAEFFAPEKRVLSQVTRVRSDSGRYDWPVGILCRILRYVFGMRDIGTGGYDGFIGTYVEGWRYHNGGHGAMLTQTNLREMARFLFSTDSQLAPSLVEESYKFRLLASISPFLVGLIVLVWLSAPFWCGIAPIPYYSVSVGVLMLLAITLDVM